MYATWLYFVGTKKDPTKFFIYGLSIPTKCPIEYSLKQEDLGSITDGLRLYVFRAVKQIAIPIPPDVIDLSLFYDTLEYHIKHILTPLYCEKFIQKKESCHFDKEIESPISSLVNITSYYTKEILELNFNYKNYIKLLQKLSEHSNQPFYGNYLNRLGCLEIAQTQPWSESFRPFGIEYDKEEKKYYFYRQIEFLEDIYVVFKCYQTSIEKNYEKLIFIPAKTTKYYFDFNVENEWGYKCSVYNQFGEILDEDCVSYIRSVNINISTISGIRKIKDAFSERDPELSKIPCNISQSFTIQNPNLETKKKELEDFYTYLERIIKEDSISEQEGFWFKRGQHKLSDIIKYLTTQFPNPDEIIIIDPYADIDTISLSIRLPANKIIVIANNKALSNKENVQKIKLVKKRIKEASGISDKSTYYYINKEFHDRFIIFKKENIIEVYCFPNSINAILKNDDFLILRLRGKVKEEAIQHMNNLISLCGPNNTLESINNESE